MAFRTNKMPTLQEKSASGSIATFNTALAMPLVNGEFTIQAYQEGSGDPSPSNIRHIVGYSAVNITHNGEVTTKSLGEDIYGGSYNSVSGVKRKTYGFLAKKWGEFELRNSNDDYERKMCGLPLSAKNPNNATQISNIALKLVSNDLTSTHFYCQGSYGIFILPVGIPNDTIIQMWYELADPIETNIGATPISTNIGDNNIFCDTGDIDLTFKDLDIAKRGSFREVFKLPS